MSKLMIAARMLLISVCTIAATSSYSAILSPTRDAVTPLLPKNTMPEQLILVRAKGHANRNVNVNVHRNVHVHGHVHHHVGGARGVVVVRPVRPWVLAPIMGRLLQVSRLAPSSQRPPSRQCRSLPLRRFVGIGPIRPRSVVIGITVSYRTDYSGGMLGRNRGAL